MPIEIATPVRNERDALLKQSNDATVKLAEMQKAYNESPELKMERDRARLADLQNDVYHLNRVLGGNTAAANEEARLAARIRDAEMRAETQRRHMSATAP